MDAGWPSLPESGPHAVQAWWWLLRAVSVVNLAAWAIAAHRLLLVQQGGAGAARSAEIPVRRLLLGLSAVYVLGCAYRSWWPVFDVPRIVLVDSWMSSVLVGRSVATVAELAFVAQTALLLRTAARAASHRTANRLAATLLPMALVAEVCSWHAVLTTSNLGHILEESLWAAGATVWTVGLLMMVRHWPRRHRAAIGACVAMALGYVAFMVTNDVPMYWARWQADEAVGRAYLSVGAGLADAAGRWTVSMQWHHWRDELGWMTMYFSVAVWMSIALVHLPLPRRALRCSR